MLRYWETEFPFLSPDKSKSGQRVYGEEELKLIRRIKELLYDEGYTIAGAKKRLLAELQNAEDPDAVTVQGEESGSHLVEEDIDETPAGDTARVERIENLEAGISRALQEVRELSALLDDSPSN